MRVVRHADGVSFEPPGHDQVFPVLLQGAPATPTDRFTVVLSRYDPGGTALLAPQQAETVYVVTSGELVMTSEGTEATLGPLDSAHFGAGTMRVVENRTSLPATMLVIRAT